MHVWPTVKCVVRAAADRNLGHFLYRGILAVGNRPIRMLQDIRDSNQGTKYLPSCSGLASLFSLASHTMPTYGGELPDSAPIGS